MYMYACDWILRDPVILTKYRKTEAFYTSAVAEGPQTNSVHYAIRTEIDEHK